MKTKSPSDPPSKQKYFYGWFLLLIGIAAMILTAPGQTVGVSEFKGLYEERLGLSAQTVALYYCYGTALGSLALPLFGFIIDRLGCRFTMTLVAFLLGVTCFLCGQVTKPWQLLLAFTFLRMLGQGALSLTASTLISLWFKKRLAFAYSVMSVGSGVGMMMVPYLFKPLFANYDFVFAFQAISIGVMALAPIALIFVIDRPHKIGVSYDGDSIESEKEFKLDSVPKNTDADDQEQKTLTQTEPGDFTFGQAIRTRSFWIMTAVQSAWALIGTGLIYNRKEIFESLNASEALVDFAVPAFFGAMVFGQIVTGLVARMFSHATMIAAGCFGMMAACLMVLMESPYSALIGFLTFGFAQGIFIVVGQSLWADFFGRSHIGKIRGLVWMIVVCASSLGGFALTLGEDAATRFQPIQISAIVLAGLFFACLFIRKPKLPNEPEQVEQE